MTGKEMVTRSPTQPITDTDKAYGRTTTRVQVATAVWMLWDRVRKERKVDQQWLAERLGKSKGRVSRLLKGPGNWTLDTVGELLEAMEGRLTLVEAHTYEEIAQGQAWKARTTRPPQPRVYVRTETYSVESDEPLPAFGTVSRASWTLTTVRSQPVIERSAAE